MGEAGGRDEAARELGLGQKWRDAMILSICGNGRSRSLI